MYLLCFYSFNRFIILFKKSLFHRKHNACWFANNKTYSKLLEEDIFIRKYLTDRLKDLPISNIFIKRKLNTVNIDIYLVKTGFLFTNDSLNLLISDLSKRLYANFSTSLGSLNVIEVVNVDVCSYLVADSIKRQLEKRLPFRKIIKSAISKSLKAGVKGVKIQISGRLNGAEIARSEWIRQGQVPLHTLRANVDYCSCTARLNFEFGICIFIFWIIFFV